MGTETAAPGMRPRRFSAVFDDEAKILRPTALIDQTQWNKQGGDYVRSLQESKSKGWDKPVSKVSSMIFDLKSFLMTELKKVDTRSDVGREVHGEMRSLLEDVGAAQDVYRALGVKQDNRRASRLPVPEGVDLTAIAGDGMAKYADFLQELATIRTRAYSAPPQRQVLQAETK